MVDWQRRGPQLFAEQPLTVKFGELVEPNQWQPHWDNDAVLVVALPLTKCKRALKGAFVKLLDCRHKGKKSGRPSMAAQKDMSTACYSLELNYTISGLRTAGCL